VKLEQRINYDGGCVHAA